MSPKYTLNKQDGLKILKQGGYVVLGSVITFLLSVVPNLDLGQYSAIILPLAVMGLNSVEKYVKGELSTPVIDPTNPLN